MTTSAETGWTPTLWERLRWRRDYPRCVFSPCTRSRWLLSDHCRHHKPLHVRQAENAQTSERLLGN